MVKSLARSVVALVIIAAAASAQVRVRGYIRNDGTYVQPHYRSNPDGSFYNNWSTKGNVNPYTGEPGTRVTPPAGSLGGSGYGALLDYYRSVNPAPQPRISAPGSPSPSSIRVPWSEPPGLRSLPSLPEALPDEELSRSDKYCEWLYSQDDLSITRCRAQQRRVLASIVVPDYSDFPQTEIVRSGRYCEWLCGDNRASFYNCFNQQVLRLARTEATFSPEIPVIECSRSLRYCEWLYGDNRASYRQCVETQARELRSYWPINASDLPSREWQRSQQYCEWLYGNNRGGAMQCLNQQAGTLRQYFQAGTMGKTAPEKARSYCEWLFNNNRASYWNCVAQRL
jgi:hypothetical protein